METSGLLYVHSNECDEVDDSSIRLQCKFNNGSRQIDKRG